jgi:hypothetical protein
MRMVPALVLAGCVPMEPSGAPFRPVSVADATPAVPPPTEPQGDFDFEAEARPPLEPGADPGPQAPVASLPVPTAGALAAAPVWDPTKPLPEVSFGVRVIAVLADVQPPRAVLGMPDGRELVVSPGMLLAEDALVVLAIGRDAVQVAHVIPSGFSAKVEVETVRALFPPTPVGAP